MHQWDLNDVEACFAGAFHGFQSSFLIPLWREHHCMNSDHLLRHRAKSKVSVSIGFSAARASVRSCIRFVAGIGSRIIPPCCVGRTNDGNGRSNSEQTSRGATEALGRIESSSREQKCEDRANGVDACYRQCNLGHQGRSFGDHRRRLDHTTGHCSACHSPR